MRFVEDVDSALRSRRPGSTWCVPGVEMRQGLLRQDFKKEGLVSGDHGVRSHELYLS